MNDKYWANAPRLEFDPLLESCPLCDSKSIAEFTVDFKGIQIYKCHSCFLLFMNPQYKSDALLEYYSRYTSHDPASIFAGYREVRKERKRRNLVILSRYLRDQARFLSIGCGDGLELVIARELGFNVEAYDVDSESAQAVHKAIGVPVISGDLFSAGFRPESYDCIYLDQVLEHPKNPANYLRLVHQLLRREGICYLGVPNIASISNRWKTLRDRLGLRPASRVGRHFDTWHHLHYYSPSCFRRVLKPIFGLDILRMFGDPESTTGTFAYNLRRAWPFIESGLIVIARNL